MNKNKFISTIVCTYNGATKLRTCLEALEQQTYPDIEIIIVNDGSLDNTDDIIKDFHFKVIKHKKNQGLATARNTGIKASKGDIIAFTDDDCIPDKDWLKNLVEAYQITSAAGFGGKIIVGNKPNSLLASYLVHQNPLSPLSSDLLLSSKIMYRFKLYMKNMFKRPKINKIAPVYSLIGANMSFKKEVLIKAGLFDIHFDFGAEEEDLSRRINSMNLGILYYTPKAIVHHTFDTRIKSILKRSFSYGIGNARLFCKHKEMNPTFYPFPFLVLLSASLVYLLKVLIIVPLVFPLILYPYWVYRYSLSGKMQFLLFPYLQMLNELSSDIGFIRGYFKYRKYW